ncbi:UNVERIFIED_CONTAM: Adenosine kinase, partial [Eudyptes robustus]
ALYYAISGFFITVCPEGILHIAEHAAKENKLFCQNLSAPFVPICFKESLDKIIPYVDLLFCNESEIEAYAQAHDYGTKDIK